MNMLHKSCCFLNSVFISQTYSIIAERTLHTGVKWVLYKWVDTHQQWKHYIHVHWIYTVFPKSGVTDPSNIIIASINPRKVEILVELQEKSKKNTEGKNSSSLLCVTWHLTLRKIIIYHNHIFSHVQSL